MSVPDSPLRQLGLIGDRLRRRADSVVLGGAEFGMLAPPETFELSAIDAAVAHAKAATGFALGGPP